MSCENVKTAKFLLLFPTRETTIDFCLGYFPTINGMISQDFLGFSYEHGGFLRVFLGTRWIFHCDAAPEGAASASRLGKAAWQGRPSATAPAGQATW